MHIVRLETETDEATKSEFVAISALEVTLSSRERRTLCNYQQRCDTGDNRNLEEEEKLSFH